MTKTIRPYASFVAVVDPPADATVDRGGLIVPAYIDMEMMYVGIVIEVGSFMEESTVLSGAPELRPGFVVYYKKTIERYQIDRTWFVSPSAIVAYEEA